MPSHSHHQYGHQSAQRKKFKSNCNYNFSYPYKNNSHLHTLGKLIWSIVGVYVNQMFSKCNTYSKATQLDIESENYKIYFKNITYPQNFHQGSMWHD